VDEGKKRQKNYLITNSPGPTLPFEEKTEEKKLHCRSNGTIYPITSSKGEEGKERRALRRGNPPEHAIPVNCINRRKAISLTNKRGERKVHRLSAGGTVVRGGCNSPVERGVEERMESLGVVRGDLEALRHLNGGPPTVKLGEV